MRPVLRLILAALALATAACDARASGPAEEQRAGLLTDLPALTGRVVDRADLLSAEAEARLAAKLAALEARRTDQLVVVTLPSLEGRTIKEVGLSLGRGWGIGQRDRDNGVLLVVAPNERQVRIEVGYGLERAIEDHEASRMIADVLIPAFKAGAFERGILVGADTIIAELDRSPLAKANR